MDVLSELLKLATKENNHILYETESFIDKFIQFTKQVAYYSSDRDHIVKV